MYHSPYAILIGFLVGLLVGFTGVGGGVLMMPLLILGLRVPPIFAVGSDVVFSFLTKTAGVIRHWRQGNVDARLAATMAVGSVPGGLIGVALLAYLRARFGGGANDVLRSLIGALLIFIPLLMIVQGWVRQEGQKELPDPAPRRVSPSVGAALTGLVGGFLVGLTSVGAGSVIMLLLLLFYRRPPRVLVGTDIFHAVILTGVTGIAHIGLGTVDFRLVGLLLVGSVPGVLLGANLTPIIPPVWLRRVLLVLLIIVGLRMI